MFTERGRAGQLIFFLIFGIYAIYYFKKKIIYSIAIISFLISCCYISYQYSTMENDLEGKFMLIQNQNIFYNYFSMHSVSLC